MFLSEMTRKMILIDSIDKVKRFTNIINKGAVSADVTSGRYVVDASSIMGILSLNVSKPVELRIHSQDERATNLVEELGEFITGDAPELTDIYAKA